MTVIARFLRKLFRPISSMKSPLILLPILVVDFGQWTSLVVAFPKLAGWPKSHSAVSKPDKSFSILFCTWHFALIRYVCRSILIWMGQNWGARDDHEPIETQQVRSLHWKDEMKIRVLFCVVALLVSHPQLASPRKDSEQNVSKSQCQGLNGVFPWASEETVLLW